MKSTKVLPVIHEKMSWEITARAESRTIYAKDGRPLLFVMGTAPISPESKLATIQIFPIIHNNGNTYIGPESVCSKMVTFDNESDLGEILDHIVFIRCSIMNNNGYLLEHVDLGIIIRMRYNAFGLTVFSEPMSGAGKVGHEYTLNFNLLEVQESLDKGDWVTIYCIDPSILQVTIDQKASAFLVKETSV